MNAAPLSFTSRVTALVVVVPMIVRGEVTGLVMLGGKASGEEFSNEDFETIRAMVRHIGVGIHTHRLLEQFILLKVSKKLVLMP